MRFINPAGAPPVATLSPRQEIEMLRARLEGAKFLLRSALPENAEGLDVAAWNRTVRSFLGVADTAGAPQGDSNG